jgi:branched-chain amino acid transport system permease protein
VRLPSLNVFLQVILVGGLTGGVYALMVSGLTLIFGVMRVVNIAHGAFLVLAAYSAYWLTQAGWHPVLSILVSAPVFFILGMGIERGLLARVGGDPGRSVLVTFAVAIILTGLMGTVWGSTFRSVRTGVTGTVLSFDLFGMGIRVPIVRLYGFGAAVAVLLVLYLLLTRTELGRGIRATIQNPVTAQLVGVNVSRIRAVTFGVGLATVAAGGIMFGLIWSFNASSSEVWISKMLAIVVLGGLGSLPGALLAALLMGVIEAVAGVTVPTYLAPIVFYLVLFLTLIFRPQGLMGARLREG